MIEERPWGTYESLVDEKYCKVKRIVVKPNQRPSYQYHYKRSEHWVIVQGTAKITLNDSDEIKKVGDHVFVPTECRHRVQNIGNEDLIFIEVQTGTYFGEDDIVRLQDDYNR